MYIYIYMQTWEKKRNETDLIEGLIAPAHNNILLRSIDTIFTKYDEERESNKSVEGKHYLSFVC